jgi:hypothetical protein
MIPAPDTHDFKGSRTQSLSTFDAHIEGLGPYSSSVMISRCHWASHFPLQPHNPLLRWMPGDVFWPFEHYLN